MGNDISSNPTFERQKGTEVVKKSPEQQADLRTQLMQKIDTMVDTLHHKNFRDMLINIRLGLSTDNVNKDVSYVLGNDLKNCINLIEKADKKTLNIQEFAQLIGYSINILLSGAKTTTSTVIAFLKDMIDENLYKFGKGEAQLEKILRENVNGFSFGPLEQGILKNLMDGAKKWENIRLQSTCGLTAGCMEGTLDTIEGKINSFFSLFKDIKLPQDYIQGIQSTLGDVSKNTQVVFEYLKKVDGGKMWNEIQTLFGERYADGAYILGYIIGNIVSDKYIPSLGGGKNMGEKIFSLIQKMFPAGKVKSIQEFFQKHYTTIAQSVKNSIHIDPKVQAGIQKIRTIGEKGYGDINSALSRDEALKTRMQSPIEGVGMSQKAKNLSQDTIEFAKLLGEKISQKLSVKDISSLSIEMYEKIILQVSGSKESDIDKLIAVSSGEVLYNLIRVKEKLKEYENILNTQVLPVIQRLNNAKNITEKNEILRMVSVQFNKYHIVAKNIFNILKQNHNFSS